VIGVGFLPGDDARVLATVAAIAERLTDQLRPRVGRILPPPCRARRSRRCRPR
jgi:GH15 family glucan-1,4-alpha-glucosidase